MLIISDYIVHYGVKGMKWGEHLFGDVYTIGGRKYPKRIAKADNRNAFKYGRDVTVVGRAKVIALKRKERLKNKLDRKPDNERLKRKYNEASKAATNLTYQYNSLHDTAKKHVKMLKRIYGGDNVSDLVYKKFGTRYIVNEPVLSKTEKVLAAAGGLVVGPLPMSLAMPHFTADGQGAKRYNNEIKQIRYADKQKRRQINS